MIRNTVVALAVLAYCLNAWGHGGDPRANDGNLSAF